MADIYMVESWFFGYAIIMQVFFAAITLFISYLSFKVHRFTQDKHTKSMMIAFFFLFISYTIQTILNFLREIGFQHELYEMVGIHPWSVLDNQGIYVHMFFMAMGMALLMYSVLKDENPSVLAYFILSSVLVLFLSRYILVGFFMLISLYLGLLTYHFFMNWRKRKKKAPLLIALAFLSLFISHIEYIFIGDSTFFYILGHIFDLIGYSLILANYYFIRKK